VTSQPGSPPDTLERLRGALGDRYEIERELGRGGMATVFLARDLKHEREVAIKVLHPELAASLGGDRFEREIKLAAKLQHPHILGLYDSGVADTLLFYVMPFVPGESLRDRITREGQLPVEDAIQVGLEVADALGYAHGQGIVHRDIKPENILLSNGHALVADFGIARAVTEAGTQKLTQTGMAVGTPVYMAPEQAAGEAVGPTADLYSLACVVYEMLAGEPPFTGKNPMAIMARHAMEQVPSIRIVRQSVPEEVEEAIFAAMEKAPADRPQTAAAFAELMGLPLGATAARRVMGRTTSRRAPTLAVQALEIQRAGRVRRQRLTWAGVGVGVVLAASAGWYFLGRGGTPAATVAGPDLSRVAVLYFQDQSRDSSLTDLADGLTEGLIRSLSSVPTLSVVSRGGVEAWRQANVSLDSIARALGVGTLVRGEVEPDGENIRVTVRLTDAAGVDAERRSFSSAGSRRLAIQDSLVQLAADLIRRRLGGELQIRQRRAGTTSEAAWVSLQRAEQVRKRGEALARGGDPEGTQVAFNEADSLLAVAESADGSWPDPMVLRGLVAYRRARLTRDRTVIRQWVDVGTGHVERALASNANNPDALELRGNLRYWSWLSGLEPDRERARVLLADARSDLEAATRLNPTQAGAWASLSHLYNQTGSGVDVNLAARRAIEADAFLDNAEVILSRLFLSSYDLGQFTDAEHWCAETRRRFPGDFAAPRCELFLMTAPRSREPDVARAWRLADSVTSMAPAPRRPYLELNSRMLVAAVVARAGQADSARALIESSKGDAELNPTRDLALFGAFAYTLVGDAGKAVDLLKLYLAANERFRQAYAEDPGWWFRSIAQEPAYKQLVGAQ